jgi:hypothetical protein
MARVAKTRARMASGRIVCCANSGVDGAETASYGQRWNWQDWLLMGILEMIDFVGQFISDKKHAHRV